MAASSDIIDVQISFYCPEDLGKGEKIHKQISCDSPSQDLIDGLKQWCSEYRARKKLRIPWHKLAMDAEILLDDERNVYLNHKLGSGKLRFKHIYDMFRGRQDTGSLCIVVKIKELKELLPDKFIGDDLYRKITQGEDPVYSYHRIAVETPPAQATEDSQHDPMLRALIVRYVKGHSDDMELRETYQRSINGQTIGSPHLGRVIVIHDLLGNGLDWLTEEDFKTQYQLPYAEKNKEGLLKEIEAIAHHEGDEDERDIPVLPGMTFQDLIIKPGAENLGSNDEDDGIHVAVRLVNRLDTLLVDGMLSDDVWLPMNVLLRVEWNNDSGKQVQKLIYNELRRLAVLVSAERLNRIVQKGGWKLELWAMPQCEGKELEQLHRFRDTKRLKTWMDPAMVKKGNRKLYVEGHLVFRKSLEGQVGEGQ